MARFESFVERLMERTFTRAARSHLQPVEIGKRLVRAMESEQSVGVEGVLVPNVYDVHLSSYDYDHFLPLRRSLTQNMETHLGRVARQRRFFLVSKPVVRLTKDSALQPGDVRVVPHMQDVEESQEEYQHTAVLPRVSGPGGRGYPLAAPGLVLPHRTYSILRSPTRVGRLADNDIVLDDKRVSRHHAEVSKQGNRWVLRDIGSTNGTAVNGKIVREAVLKPGDTISLGGLEARWEQ